MTSTDAFRITSMVVSLIATIYISTVAIRNKEIRNLCVFPLSLTISVFLRSVFVLLNTPLNPKEIIFFNDWSFVINIQTVIMLFFMIYYQDSRGKND